MGLYADYIRESRKMDCIETNEGFVSYLIDGDQCYIEDLYISPSHRRKKLAFHFVDQIKKIAKSHGCTTLMTTVNLTSVDPSTSLKVILSYGAKVYSSNNNIILAKMEI